MYRKCYKSVWLNLTKPCDIPYFSAGGTSMMEEKTFKWEIAAKGCFLFFFNLFSLQAFDI